MNNFEQNIDDYTLLYEPENSDLYILAKSLYNSGYHTTILQNHEKAPMHKEWQKKSQPPVPTMTGLGIVTGTLLNDKYIFALDIDIYRNDKLKKILSEIKNQIGKPVYLDETPSGGYRIIFYCEVPLENKSKQFNLAEENDAARHKDNVDFFANNKQVLIAPSKAMNKYGEIKEYKQVSEVGLLDSAVLTEYELKSLLKMLDTLSKKYSSQKFRHQHSISHEQREKIRQSHRDCTTEGYITGPLANGERHCAILNWKSGVNEAEFNKIELTGIVLKVGFYEDENVYLNCFDIDIKNHKSGELPMDILEQLKQIFGDDFYLEKSVSGGYHILFKTKKALDINKKYELSNGVTLEVLCTKYDTVNIACTSAYINKYEFSGHPEYGTCTTSSDIKNITTVDAEDVRKFLNGLKSCRKNNGFKNTTYNSNSSENRTVSQYMHQYDTIQKIDKQIKAVFPETNELLDFLGIRHSNNPKPDYINFYSQYTDDGNNPDALLYHNNNDNPKNKWSGFSLTDFHSGETISSGQYLCKYCLDLFDKLMEKIGYGKTVQVTTIVEKLPIVYNCGQYISDELKMNIFNDIMKAIKENNHSDKQIKIAFTAPTGIGKTEMFYRLAEDLQAKIILALPYTSQVDQGKNRDQMTPGVMTGLSGKDSDVPETGSVFMTYDKAPIVEKSINPAEHIMVIDEAHNLVNQSGFRGQAIKDLQRLSDKCKAVVYMTATPEYLNRREIDLFIKIEQEDQPSKQVCLCKYKKEGAVKAVVEALLSQHISGTIDVIYTRSIKQLTQMEKLIQNKDIETHVIYSDIKENSNVYKNISKNQRLSSKSIFKEGGVLLTTNLIIDGVNILDDNIGNIFLVDIKSTTDLIQFPSRFRNGWKNFFLFVSGNAPHYKENKNRQELINKYYNLAYRQKQSFDTFKYNMAPIVGSDYLKKISLTKRYTFLDDDGTICENMIYKQVQDIEARRMNYNISEIEGFLQNYNFTIQEVSQEHIIQNRLTAKEIEQANIDLTGETVPKLTILVEILIDDLNSFKRQELIKDYRKNRISTGTYKALLSCPKCMKALYRYCTGLEMNAEQPLELIRSKYSDNDIYSMKRTYQNLKLELSGKLPLKDDKYYRFIELREFIRGAIKTGVPLTFTGDQLLTFAKDFNSRYAAVYNEKDIKTVVEDLKDIFNVETKTVNKKRQYTVKEEWSLNNIYGLSFS